MKKIFTSTLLLAAMAMTANAQIASNFYRLQNINTERYIWMHDDKGTGDVASASADLGALNTIRPFSAVEANPGSIFYISNVEGSQYDIAAQGTSVSKMAGGRLFPNISGSASSCQIWATYSGVTATLNDQTREGKETSYVVIKGSNSTWRLIPVDTDANYIAVQPTVEADGAYWATYYASFAYELTGNMKAYYVNTVSDNGFELKELGNTVAGGTPVIIRCESNVASNNKIKPLTSGGTEVGDNKLGGTYFASWMTGHYSNVPYEIGTMRVLGASDGKLAFVIADKETYLANKKYIPHNTCWLNVAGTAADALTVTGTSGINSVKASDNTSKGTFTLTGVQIPEGEALQPGIYIKDGKKVMVK